MPHRKGKHMEKEIRIDKNKWIFLPIQATPAGEKADNRVLEIFCREETLEKKLFEFQIPVGDAVGETYPASYYARFPVKQFANQTLILRGELPEAFFNAVKTIEGQEQEGALRRPSLHFTPERGWLNDPNGLVYADGYYHLYFQYNPFDVQWENMCWGHAVSRDLLHWEQKDTVLFPDENGTMFSGSGIINERNMLGLPEHALVFFYTAAGGANAWSKGKEYTQRIAYSVDGGETLIKTEIGVLPTVSAENRDPKVFWHEESGAYIMVLWLEKNDFGIFRSKDLKDWRMSQRLKLEGAWECPDLVRLEQENGEQVWMFWSADGYYFWGDFDGYCFKTDGVRHQAYINRIPYAAQTYSGVTGRVISVPWLRISNNGRIYTGAMGLPREIRVCSREGQNVLVQLPVREYEQAKQLVYDSSALRQGENGDLRDAAMQSGYEKCVLDKAEERAQDILIEETKEELTVKAEKGAVELQVIRRTEETSFACCFGEIEVSYEADSGKLSVGTETFETGKNIRDFSFLLDDVILEVTAGGGTVLGIFEVPDSTAEIRVQKSSFERIQIFREC